MISDPPYSFMLEFLHPLELQTKRMFGVISVYPGEKVLFALRKNDKKPGDDGIWVATKEEHHQLLKEAIPVLRPLTVYGIKSWLVLPAKEDLFEDYAYTLAELIKTGSPLVGNIPPVKKKKKSTW